MSTTYTQVLSDLRRAAHSDQRYEAVRQAENLEAVEAAALNAFCETAWQIDVNRETEQLSDPGSVVSRISVRAELDLSDHRYSAAAKAPYVEPVKAALEELQRTIDLASFDKELNRRYRRACYR